MGSGDSVTGGDGTARVWWDRPSRSCCRSVHLRYNNNYEGTQVNTGAGEGFTLRGQCLVEGVDYTVWDAAVSDWAEKNVLAAWLN